MSPLRHPPSFIAANIIVGACIAATTAVALAAVPPATAPPYPPYTPPPGSAPGIPIAPIGATSPPQSHVRVTGASPFAAGCDGAPATGIAFFGAEVEPYVAVDPHDSSHLIGVWQQDRWSDGGARGTRTAYSFDGGLTWQFAQAAFTRCTGGNAANGGNYARASDPWVTIGPDGIAYQIAIAFNGGTLLPGSQSAVVASRSVDGGRTWSGPATLILDGSAAFNDKESITADPVAPGMAYATWDRLEANDHGPAYFTRTTNGGENWETARPIYDPGARSQTLNNQIVVTSAGGNSVLYDFFTEFVPMQGSVAAHLTFVRSLDRGITWSGPTRVADSRAIGTVDPQNPAREIRDGAHIASFASGPNNLLVGVWQDSRFSAGLRDGIAFSQSTDGGATWSAPLQINAAPAVAALLPAVTVRNDGTIGVVYYDMRDDTADPATLLVDVWIATSTDGVHWSERRIAGPFDFNTAPSAEGGLFVGDYQGLASGNGVFAAFVAETNPDLSNRTDVFAAMVRSVLEDVAGKAGYEAIGSGETALTPQIRERLDASIRRTLRQRSIGAISTVPRAPQMTR